MSRYIDADKLKEECYKFANDVSRSAMAFVQGQINAAPTADVVEVRHGRWIKQKQDTEVMQKFHDMGLGQGMSVNSIYWTCSLCGNWGTPHYKYCPNCGSKMDGERSENGT
jgi:rubrerythrin